MSEHPPQTDPEAAPDDGQGSTSDEDHGTPRVVIAVIRTGGIAGIRRQWRVEPQDDDASAWIAMIDSCPWDADDDTGTGADRFVWVIRARTPSERREREVPDSALDGPWRALVDAVRAASD